MALYLLKKGCFVTGSNRVADEEKKIPATRSRLYRADDPTRVKGSYGNIIETDEDLVAEDPQKFEEYKGPRPAYLDDPAFRGAVPPTTRDTHRDRLQAANVAAAKAFASSPTASEASAARTTNEESPSSPAEAHAEASAKEEPKEQTETQRRDYHAQLDRMSLSDLKRQAETRGVDLKGAVKREDILKTIKESPR